MSNEDIDATPPTTPDEPEGVSATEFQERVFRLVGPQLELHGEATGRVLQLLTFADNLESSIRFQPAEDKTRPSSGIKMQTEAVREMQRAAVVLTHAYLEDFLRTIAEVLLPECDENSLKVIPLAGLPGRPEKFHVGNLVQHKGKTVDELLRESVREHLDRKTFNNKGEIEEFLRTLRFDLSGIKEDLAAIQQMIQRRHQIVHRADKQKSPSSSTPVLQPIEGRDAERWLRATHQFMLNLCGQLLAKQSLLEKQGRNSNPRS